MSEINNLPPSLREKERYLKFRIHSEQNQELGDLVTAVWDSALEYLGEKGCSEANFWVIGNKFDEKDQEGIIRVSRDREDDLRAVLTFISEIGGEKAVVEITQVSGSISKLE